MTLSIKYDSRYKDTSVIAGFLYDRKYIGGGRYRKLEKAEIEKQKNTLKTVLSTVPKNKDRVILTLTNEQEESKDTVTELGFVEVGRSFRSNDGKTSPSISLFIKEL